MFSSSQKDAIMAHARSNSLAYLLFHAIAFEQKVFSKFHASKSLRETCEYHWLVVAEAVGAVTQLYVVTPADVCRQ